MSWSDLADEPAIYTSVCGTAASILVRRCMAVLQVSCCAHDSPVVVQQLGVLTEQATCLDSCGEDRDRRTEAACVSSLGKCNK